MKSRERVDAALRGAPVDRPPVSFWGHFYHRESNAPDLVAATREAWERHRWDWIKLNPRKHYHVEPWGVRYRYTGIPGEKPQLTEWPIHEGADWAAIAEQPLDAPAFAEQVEAVRTLRAAIPAEVPIIETVFTPLAVLGEMVETPASLRMHMDTHAPLVRRALEAVTRSYVPYVRALMEAGADGIFFATVDWASRDLLEPDVYRAWARTHDLEVMAAARDASFNVLHVCKRRNLLFELADYPVHAFSWASTDPTNPNLEQALARLPGAVMGGISQDTALQQETPDAVLAEYRTALRQTGGRRWLVAPGCSIPPGTPDASLTALREAVEETTLAPGGQAR